MNIPQGFLVALSLLLAIITTWGHHKLDHLCECQSTSGEPLSLTTKCWKSAMNEIWLPVIGYEGFYEVSNLGRVKSLDRMVRTMGDGRKRHRGKVLSTKTRTARYETVELNKLGKPHRFVVHHLVAYAFVGPRPEGMYIDHINNESQDNRASNLCYISPRQNVVKDMTRKNGLPTGVHLTASGSYKVMKSYGQRQYYLGVFSSQAEASAMYQSSDEADAIRITRERKAS